MAITRYSNFDKTVNTIIDRNNIANKVDGMTVIVLDAIADTNVGSGKAVYRWDSSDNTWILISKTSTETMNFITEEAIVAHSEMSLSYIPVNNQVWSAVLLNADVIYADLNVKDVIIAMGKITNIPSQYNGMKLRVTYAYGTLASQVTTLIEDTVDAINFDKFVVDITDVEFTTNLKRDGLSVFGVEVDCGLLVNAGIKEVLFNFDSAYNYWLDNEHSFCYNGDDSYPINYNGNVGESMSCYLDKKNNKILISCSDDKTSFTGRVVLYYTK